MFQSKLRQLLLMSLFFCAYFLKAQSLPCKEVIGYYPNWQWYDRAKLVRPTTIDYSKYTIINYAFFKPELNGNISSTDAWSDDNLLNGQPNWAQGGYYPNTSIVSLAHNAGVKIIPSIGGWTLSDNFPTIAASATLRTAFANSCVALINQYNFDGIDIDWEYPGYTPNSGTAADKQNYTLFLQAIRTALNTLGVQKNKTYYLTACFGASQANMANVEWANVVPLLNYVNLMSYDFFGAWDPITNHNAPLFPPAQGDPTFNINSAVNSLLTTYNVPASKICAGLAFYGRSHITQGTPTLHGAGTGQPDKVTFGVDDGSPQFYNVLLQQNLFNKYTDNLTSSPYLLGKNGLKTFVSYDDTTSITAKATYIKNKNLAGCIIWEITGDYIETAPNSGIVAGTPLASAIKNVFCGTTSTTCSTPNNISLTPNATSANISWSNTGAVSYNVQYKLSTATTWTTLTSNSNSLTLNNLTPSTAYQVQIQGVCASLSSTYSTVLSFTTTATTTGGTGGGTGGGTSSNPCLAPSTFNFTSANYIPMGEIKIGQARLNPIWGTTVDAYIPSNKKTWAISMAHAAHLFRNVVKTDKIPANFYFATAAKESFCGCDNTIAAAPTGTSFPFNFQASSTGDGCFQIENLSAYTELNKEYPQRFPVGQHANLIGNANFETAALGKAYYDIFTVKYWEAHKNWNPIGFFNTATDPNAAIKLMAVAYNRGLWYPELGTVLNTDRNTAITASTISPYFIGNNYGYDYQNALSNYTNILGNNLTTVPATLLANNPSTGTPYNQFNSFYDPQITWTDVDTYIDKIKPLYPSVNITTLKANVLAVFNGINGGNSISFRYNLGQVLDVILLNLPADDPSANISINYGCGWQNTGNQTNIPPTCVLTQPAQNQIFTTPATVTLTAVASDPDGTIAKVEFYNGTTLLGTATAAPYTYIWQNVTAGTYSITAKAYDNLSASTSSTVTTITVAAPVNLPPAITISLASTSTTLAPANVVFNAVASDPDGTVSKVEYYNGTSLLATVTLSPFSYTWSNVAAGTYQIKAIAYDNLGAKTTSNILTITITNPTPAYSVKLTSPAGNAVYYQVANVPLTATVAPSTTGIQFVRFYRNGTLIGTSKTAPYSLTWTNAPLGTWTITAVATDLNNKTYTSVASTIFVIAKTGNVAPLCSILQPTANQTFTAPANVVINVDASDPNGTITKVDFYNGTTLLGTDNTWPYSFTWPNVAKGTYTITAVATDNQAATTTSSPVTIVVNNPVVNVPPTCVITQPFQNQNYTAPATININTTATDPDGTITKVELYSGTTLLTTLTTAPYNLILQNVGAGTYSVTAKAYDNSGAVTTSSTINYTVNAIVVTNQAPTCSITQPTNNQTFTAPANVVINASASDPDGTVTKVEFYNGTTLLGTDNTAPYSFTWSNLAVGTYNIIAKAYDNIGAITTSSTITITVNPIAVTNQAPTCVITQPTNNQTFAAPANVVINATASDPDGTVTKVEFYNGTTLLSTSTTAPYTYTWASVAAGTYSLTVKATDNLGAVTTSTAVSIVVNQPSTLPLCSQYAAYAEGNPYVNGSVVTNNNGGVYTCLVAGWCSGAAFAYSPGIGSAWQSAWNQTGTCNNGLPSCATTPAYVALATYQTGSVVKNNNSLYQCTVPSWCSSTASFYAPGTGSAWQTAWKLMGPCPGVSPKVVSSNPKQVLAELFPNPTNDDLNIVIDNAPIGNLELSVFDSNGKQILLQNIDNQNNIYVGKVSLIDLPSGIYYLKLTNQDWTNTWKVSKF